MKHLKLLPLLIAAAFAVPRAHAAVTAPSAQQETGSYLAGAIGLGLLLLGAGRSRVEPFRPMTED